jgi:hypothetical protein
LTIDGNVTLENILKNPEYPPTSDSAVNKPASLN